MPFHRMTDAVYLPEKCLGTTKPAFDYSAQPTSRKSLSPTSSVAWPPAKSIMKNFVTHQKKKKNHEELSGEMNE